MEKLTRRLGFTAGLLLVACAARGAGKPGKLLPEGPWGGPQVILNVRTDGAEVEFNCAQGSIPSAIALDGKQAFKVKGEYRQGSGKEPPVPPPAQDATYEGKLSGRTLELTVILKDQKLGPYTLTQGESSPIAKCAQAGPRGGRPRSPDRR